ncbi:MAG: 4-alpha-glucanotransferase [Candidatus Cloacimonetes bacterium]|nr:4-alpha-glucanotransferase [Candidatus Cloacimonadota bacterium]
MKQERGILLPIASLNTEYGIGDLGPAAYKFADYLHDKDYDYWQILPLTFCGYGDSPYNPLSSWAGFPFLISPELLYKNKLISKADLESSRLKSTSQIDYESVYKTKGELLEKAARNYLAIHPIEDFIAQHAPDAKPFIAFICLQELYGNTAWFTWAKKTRKYSEELYQNLLVQYQERMYHAAALQAIFREQVSALKAYLNGLGIRLIGDIPLYVSYESADVWANQQNFLLDENGKRLYMAGVPPDAFSDEGQLWGNPIYNWAEMEKNGYSWFTRRIISALAWYDLLRIDHFIGIVNFWQVDGDSTNAIDGKWVEGPAEKLMHRLMELGANNRLIAEDLGILTDRVNSVRDAYGLPGMIILQFCFDNQVPQTDSFPPNKIIYTGTHDNDTLLGWYLEAETKTPDRINNLKQYFLKQGLINNEKELTRNTICPLMLKAIFSTPCKVAIVPYQDVLALDSKARINTPGTALGNWRWRLQ